MGKLAPTVKIELDGTIRTLKIDLNAMIELQRNERVNFTTNLEYLRWALWLVLRHEDPTLTAEQAGALVHPGNVGEVDEAVSKILMLSFPAISAETEAPKVPEAIPFRLTG